MSQNEYVSQLDESRGLVQQPSAFDQLKPQQQQFVLELLKHNFNATKAAIEAGYSEKSARSQASQLLTKLNIQAAISEQVKAQQERIMVDADYLLEVLRDDVEADLADLFKENGNLKPVKEWPPVFRRGLVASLKVEAIQVRGDDKQSEIVQVKEVRLADRTKLKVLLGKHRAVQAFDKEKDGNEIHIHIEGKDALL
ncbi:MAG: terminase small subunit [Candidatus Thiodiazotropha lotti]|nr:terminase small subunit [Candidatus Thiodiazotropha lotti]MCW4221982.1 terminase small subunit [Candidatus Thiodiazotropha lotti]